MRPESSQHPDRVPPHSIDAEQAVLGCLLMDPKTALVEIQQRVGCNDVFYETRNALVFGAAMALAGAGVPIDMVTLTGRLADDGHAERVGGAAYLAELLDRVVSVAQLPAYLDVVVRKWQLRQAIRRATEIVSEAYDVPEDVEGFLSRAEERVFSLPRAVKDGPKTAQGLALSCIERIEKYARGRGMFTGLPTQFAYLDKLTGGLQNGELIVIGGRPGTGKTSLAMNIAERVAWWDTDKGPKPGHPVGVLSMEMSADDLMLRLVCSRARVNFHKLRTGCMSRDDEAKLTEVIPEMSQAPIIIDDAASLTAMEMRSRLRLMKARYGIRLAVIDYLQLAKLPPEYSGDRVNGIAAVSGALLASAKELQIPIIVISQLSRESEKGGRSSIPKMSDLRDSGAIEQDAHFIGLLYKAPMEEEDEAAMRERLNGDPHAEVDIPVKMEVCKNRNGPTGYMDLVFRRWCMRFEDCQRPTRPTWEKPKQPKGRKADAKVVSDDDLAEIQNQRLL